MAAPADAKAAKALLCPSSPCREGARLIGVVQANGVVAFTTADVRVDANFVHVARLGRRPEERFRFAGPCHRGNCAQWTGSRCGVVDDVAALAAAQQVTLPSPPACSIRDACRWFDQRGVEACTLCPLVTTERAT